MPKRVKVTAKELADAVARLLAEREAQGLSTSVSDPAVLSQIAAAIRSVRSTQAAA